MTLVDVDGIGKGHFFCFQEQEKDAPVPERPNTTIIAQRKKDVNISWREMRDSPFYTIITEVICARSRLAKGTEK